MYRRVNYAPPRLESHWTATGSCGQCVSPLLVDDEKTRFLASATLSYFIYHQHKFKYCHPFSIAVTRISIQQRPLANKRGKPNGKRGNTEGQLILQLRCDQLRPLIRWNSAKMQSSGFKWKREKKDSIRRYQFSMSMLTAAEHNNFYYRLALVIGHGESDLSPSLPIFHKYHDFIV